MCGGGEGGGAKNTAHIETTAYIRNTNGPKAELMFLLGLLFEPTSFETSGGGGWVQVGAGG